MKLNRLLLGALILTAIVGVGPMAQASSIPSTFEYLTYDVTLDSGITGVSDIVFLEQVHDGTGMAQTYSLKAGSSSVTARWPPTFPPVLGTVAIGLVTGIPGDSGTTLAVFGNFTPGEIGEAFSTLFPDASESTLISELMLPAPERVPPPRTLPYYESFFTDAADDDLFISPGGDFDVVAFSNGQLIGTGTFVVTTTPEPSSITLFGLGLLAGAGFYGLRMRKRIASGLPLTSSPSLL